MGAYFAIKRQDFTDVLWKWKKVVCPVAVALMVCFLLKYLPNFLGVIVGERKK